MEDSREPIGWEKVYIFISSTFNDMHAERDYLVKRVFPELQDWCERRKLRLVDIDLRWGVTEADASSKRAVKVCLERINDCRPFFLCLLGQRHGWAPGADGISEDTFDKFPDLREALHPACSVTELEIRHAILKPFASRDPKDRNRFIEHKFSESTFFYFRDPGYLNELRNAPRQLLCTYTDEFGPEDETGEEGLLRELSGEALRDLKERIIPEALRNLRERLNRPATPPSPPVVYVSSWRAELRTPELTLPLECSTVEKTNAGRWRSQWNRFARLDLAETDLRVPERKQSAADEYNATLTRGRLSEFRSLDDARGVFRAGTDLARIIQYDLQQAIQARFPDHVEAGRQDDLQKEIDQQEQFLFINSEGFIERAGDFDELDDYAANESNKLFVLTAPGGMGKTMLLANWVDRYHERIKESADQSIHFRFIGASDHSTTVYSLLRFLLRELKEIAGKFDGEIPDDPIKLRQVWLESLSSIGQRGKTVIVIDALNQLETELADVGWLPQKLPQNIKLIASFKRDDQASEELYQRLESTKVIFSEVKPFKDLDDRGRLVKAYLSQYLKELDDDHVETLINLDGASNPLYLKVVLSELRVFGAFANLAAKIRGDFGNTPVTAFQAVLGRLETDPVYSPIEPRRAVPLLFGLLAYARHGLSGDELVELFIQALELEDNDQSAPAAADTVYLFLRQVRPFLARREGRYDFFYESFRIAARECYGARTSEDQLSRRPPHEWHGYLARYFRRKTDPTNDGTWSGNYPRGLRDLPYHMLEGRLYDELFPIARDESFLTIQTAAFPGEPQLPLGTVQAAIEGAARIDDAARMAEFVLVHARRVMDLSRESPLDALRSGNLERACELADLYEIEPCALWHLLLTWELKDAGKIEEAKALLSRIVQKDLATLTGENAEEAAGFVTGENAADLLMEAIEIDQESVASLSQRLLGDSARAKLSAELAGVRRYSSAIEIARSIGSDNKRATALKEIAAAQAKASLFSQALATARDIEGEDASAEALKEIAATQAQAGFLVDAIVTARLIQSEWYSAWALREIAAAQAQAGEVGAAHASFASALRAACQIQERDVREEAFGKIAAAQTTADSFGYAVTTARLIQSQTYRAQVLREIGAARANGGDPASAREILAEAVATACAIEDKDQCDRALYEIADTQTEAGLFTDAVATARRLSNEYSQARVLGDIAAAQVEAGLFADALASALEIQDKYHQVGALAGIAVAHSQAGEYADAGAVFAEALAGARLIPHEYFHEKALEEIAAAQSRAGLFSDALATAREIQTQYAREETLKGIAAAQARTGEADAAHATARLIQEEWIRAEALAKIAAAQAQAGEAAGARATFASALVVARLIDDGYGRTGALRRIAAAQNCAGDAAAASATLSEAVAAALGVQDKYNRAAALREIATAQSEKGESAAARATFNEAVASALENKGNDGQEWIRREEVLRQIAEAQREAGLFPDALSTLERIANATTRASGLQAIAAAQTRAALFGDALATVRLMGFGSLQGQVLKEIAAAQIESGEAAAARSTLAYALGTTRQTENVYEQSNTLKRIAASQTHAGVFDDALATACQIKHSDDKADALKELAAAQISAGLLREAIFTACQIPFASDLVEALTKVAAAETQVGEVAAARDILAYALATARQIEYEPYQRAAMKEVAAGQRYAGLWGEAVATAQLIQNESERAEALSGIAAAQSQAHLFGDALATIRHIENESPHRAVALGEIAAAQAQAGETEAARAIFAGALAAARQNELGGAWELRAIAAAQTRARLFSDARATALQIQIEGQRAETLGEISVAQTRAGDPVAGRATYDDALATACQIQDEYSQAAALEEISAIQTQAGLFDHALATARQIQDEYHQSTALRKIAAAQTRAGDAAAARATLADALAASLVIDYEPYRTEAVREIAIAQAQVGSSSNALATARLIRKDPDRAKALGEIAVAQAQAGDIVAARATFANAIAAAHQIQDRYPTRELTQIAAAQARVGETAGARATFGDALAIAQLIHDKYDQAGQLKEITRAAVRAGFGNLAPPMVDGLLVDRDSIIPEISEALVDARDRENFNSLLIPCAYYLNAAYRVCGLLARLYPEQATAVAAVVSPKAAENKPEELDQGKANHWWGKLVSLFAGKKRNAPTAFLK